jgi:hypothetical protein
MGKSSSEKDWPRACRRQNEHAESGCELARYAMTSDPVRRWAVVRYLLSWNGATIRWLVPKGHHQPALLPAFTYFPPKKAGP